MNPLRYARYMREWVFRTTTRSMEVLNTLLLLNLGRALLDSDLTIVSFPSVTGERWIDVPTMAYAAIFLGVVQIGGLFTDRCSRCRKVTGLILIASSLLWGFMAAMTHSSYILGANGYSSPLYVGFAILCYLAGEVIREYVNYHVA